jgi:hypothetical protein
MLKCEELTFRKWKGMRTAMDACFDFSKKVAHVKVKAVQMIPSDLLDKAVERLKVEFAEFVSLYCSVTMKPLHEPLSRPAATLSPHSGERAGRGGIVKPLLLHYTMIALPAKHVSLTKKSPSTITPRIGKVMRMPPTNFWLFTSPIRIGCA